LVVRLLDRVGRSGRLRRDLAVALDLARSVSVGYSWRRVRAADESAGDVAYGMEPAYRSIWLDAASAVGADVVELPAGFIEIRANEAWTRVWRQWVMLDDEVTLKYALQKSIVQERLAASGLPVPEYLQFAASELMPAAQFMERGPTPCVVKPVANGGGHGVTSNVRTLAHLMRARLRAWRGGESLMIERQIAGDNYRFLFLDGALLDVVRRRPPTVTADGSSTIEALIEAENARRLARAREVLFRSLQVDLDCILTLEAAGLKLGSVLPAGTPVPVKAVINQNTLDDNETVRGPIAQGVVDQARAAAELIGVRLAGVDVIASDLSRPLEDTGGVILEVNGIPSLHHHYEVADTANATRVAIPILEALLSR
jgi:cyanophycin synthetase